VFLLTLDPPDDHICTIITTTWLDLWDTDTVPNLPKNPRNFTNRRCTRFIVFIPKKNKSLNETSISLAKTLIFSKNIPLITFVNALIPTITDYFEEHP
jgi:hypothetical protein